MHSALHSAAHSAVHSAVHGAVHNTPSCYKGCSSVVKIFSKSCPSEFQVNLSGLQVVPSGVQLVPMYLPSGAKWSPFLLPCGHEICWRGGAVAKMPLHRVVIGEFLVPPADLQSVPVLFEQRSHPFDCPQSFWEQEQDDKRCWNRMGYVGLCANNKRS